MEQAAKPKRRRHRPKKPVIAQNDDTNNPNTAKEELQTASGEVNEPDSSHSPEKQKQETRSSSTSRRSRSSAKTPAFFPPGPILAELQITLQSGSTVSMLIDKNTSSKNLVSGFMRMNGLNTILSAADHHKYLVSLVSYVDEIREKHQ